ncbi:hypothetical protein [Streptomyces crystallinus]|uniref:Uncharacterized protein n=1 Tax=Streptomyces crystallinus TaxID=68191 RepID=A0ABP3RTN4_9ACTN
MNPTTYATLYGPYQPPRPRPRHGRQVLVVVLAAVLWAITFVSVAELAFLVGMVALWGAAEGQPVGEFVMTFVGIVGVATTLLVALAFAPGVRRLAPAMRLLLLGALACPVPTVYAALV